MTFRQIIIVLIGLASLALGGCVTNPTFKEGKFKVGSSPKTFIEYGGVIEKDRVFRHRDPVKRNYAVSAYINETLPGCNKYSTYRIYDRKITTFRRVRSRIPGGVRIHHGHIHKLPRQHLIVATQVDYVTVVEIDCFYGNAP